MIRWFCNPSRNNALRRTRTFNRLIKSQLVMRGGAIEAAHGLQLLDQCLKKALHRVDTMPRLGRSLGAPGPLAQLTDAH